MLSMGQEVKPHELMPLMDEVFDELNNDVIKNELKTTENNARVALVANITKDMIYLSPDEVYKQEETQQTNK